MFNSQRGKSGYCRVCVYFGRLAIDTSRDEFAEEGGHSWPPIVFLHAMESSEEPFMSSSRGVMERFYEIVSSRFRNVEAVFEI